MTSDRGPRVDDAGARSGDDGPEQSAALVTPARGDPALGRRARVETPWTVGDDVMDAADPDFPMDPPMPFDGLLAVLGYAVAPTAELYVAVMDAAVDARSRFHLHLRPAEVAAAVGVDHDTATAALNYLASHGALHRTYDASEAETLSEFYKGAFLYQLTPAGTAAHQGVREVLSTRASAAGQLSAGLLPRIHEALGAIQADAQSQDDSRLKADFASLFAVFEELSESAATYLRELDGEITELARDGERLSAYKAAVLTYLQKFNRELSRWSPLIVGELTALAPHADDLLVRAARFDAPPRADGTYDDGPVEQLRAQWNGTVGWFCTRPDRPATTQYVSAAMIAAINRVLGAITRVQERRLRRVSRESDFAQLADWFSTAEAAAAHELWDAATGLWGARHFYDLAGDEETDRRKSFWDAGQAEIPPRVRASAKRGSPGRPGKRADHSEAKHLARTNARNAAAQAIEARARLAVRTPVRLSDLAELDESEFRAFLDVLGAVLAENSADGTRQAVLPGATITLSSGGDGQTTVVRTPHGRFVAPDDTVRIDVTGAIASSAAVAS